MSAISSKNNYSQKVERVLLIILLLNIVVVIIKGVTSWLTSSLTVLKDTIHSSMDAANNIVGNINYSLCFSTT
ncbi:MAG: hypothetical protein IPK14_25625 [Blastocatellia bacterium]|nr:hypothetical protein [Blastocatellia bacterium]